MLWERCVLQWLLLASSKVCGEKTVWEGVWPYLDPMDSVCLCTASMEWNVPGKYGPHGEPFFFVIQKEPPIAPNSETFSLFINPGISFPCFSADVLKKCALIALHVMAEGGRDWNGFQVSELGEEWKMGCRGKISLLLQGELANVAPSCWSRTCCAVDVWPDESCVNDKSF